MSSARIHSAMKIPNRFRHAGGGLALWQEIGRRAKQMSLAHAPASIAAPTFARWEPVAAALCLAQFSEPLFAAIAQSQGLTDPPGYARLFFLPVYAFLAWAMWRDRAQAFAAARAVPLIVGLLALAAVSTLWSIDSAATLRRSVWLGLTIAFGLYLAWRHDWKSLLNVLAGGFLVLIAGSFALGLLAGRNHGGLAKWAAESILCASSRDCDSTSS